MPNAKHLLLATVAVLASIQVAAQEDSQRIPVDALRTPDEKTDAAATQPAGTTAYVEVGMDAVMNRQQMPAPSSRSGGDRINTRAAFDLRAQQRFGNGFGLYLSGRASATGGSLDDRTPGKRLDLREALLSRVDGDGLAWKVGRVNLRNGVALGYNPTDFFRANTIVDTSTRDPVSLRESRLGTFMLDVQHIGESGSLQAAIAPRITKAIGLDNQPSAGLAASRTNASHRLLLRAVRDLGADFSPEFLLFKESGRAPRIGASITRSIGQQATWYAEWAAGKRERPIDAAIRYGVATGDLPESGLRLLSGAGRRMAQELVVGGSWASTGNFSVNLEFLFNQNGLSRREWKELFHSRIAGQSAPSGLIWYARDHASLFQEPLARRSVFVRAQWDNIWSRGLSLVALGNINADDRSALYQLSLDYRLDATQRIRATWQTNAGRSDSQYGSVRMRQAFTLTYVAYLP
ncbi:hypothetical protein [Pseudorhodoferax sp. Leaf274]|uniref:hypothetical protein n=1 Tax=Pseudorhodoferax sp. Leaf274 TaxID=1736318 RepID=UPI0012E215D4|nr:hypothetical protein [Pseudorhodoferax sp. Leaf274]